MNTLEQAQPMAKEIAGYAGRFQEGDVGELVIQTCCSISDQELMQLEQDVRNTGAIIERVYQDGEGVHVRFRVAVLPLLAIALISLAALIPVGIIGWRLMQITPEELLKLTPWLLIGAGTLVILGVVLI